MNLINNENTEEKIIEATFKILQKEGVKKATTKKIAAEAGVNEITIFRKFKTKKNLIEIVKEHYMKIFIDKIENIFDFSEDEEIDNYLTSNFNELLNLTDEDFSIMKIAMEEVQPIPEKKRILSRVSDVILNKLEEFFKLQIEKGKIKKEINPRMLSIMCLSITFQSVALWKVYDKDTADELEAYKDEFLNMLYNGILA